MGKVEQFLEEQFSPGSRPGQCGRSGGSGNDQDSVDTAMAISPSSGKRHILLAFF